ncbi:hypothetical protein EVAR_68661_1 [Eumeta japonica]|uniref:Uncharacterized protein n=1 Tax=Eumeta variegata TaxID=151549 RepID=A0A4C2A0R4_EUMVA|nr:hypothetical protein EVAR_68661_1 [Eumeta japonica]
MAYFKKILLTRTKTQKRSIQLSSQTTQRLSRCRTSSPPFEVRRLSARRACAPLNWRQSGCGRIFDIKAPQQERSKLAHSYARH